jgi:hypothetical protein
MLEIFHWDAYPQTCKIERSDPVSYFQKKFEGDRLRIRKDMGLQSFWGGHLDVATSIAGSGVQ